MNGGVIGNDQPGTSNTRLFWFLFFFLEDHSEHNQMFHALAASLMLL